MIIDSHVHLYAPTVQADPKAWAEAQNEPNWLSLVRPSGKRPLQGWKSVTELIEDMDAAGVEKAVILGWYWENHRSCEENLNWQIEWVRSFPDRLIGFAPFHAGGGQRGIDLLQLAFDIGFRGIGELNPPAQGYDYDDPILGKALDLAAEYEACVNFHVTDPHAPDHPGKIDTPIDALLRLAATHAETQFIFAHLGGDFTRIHSGGVPANVVFDTAAVPLLYQADKYKSFCDAVGADKLLFGTDYPLRVFPRDPDAPDFKAPLQQLRDSGLDSDALAAVLGGNAVRVLNLK